MLAQHHDGLWSAASPHLFYGLHLGTRMTVARLPGGGLWVHSPIRPTPELVAALTALGPVQHLVCPNLFHHVYAGEMQTAFPDALLHGPPALARKRRDLQLDAVLSDAPHPDWGAELVPLTIRGTALHETVFLHPRARTLVSSDLVLNFQRSPHWPTDLYLRLGGVRGRIGFSRLLRLAYRDRQAARASLERLLEWDFDRVILAHGDVVERGGREAVRGAFRWLGVR
jgi:hypothetical protein